MTSKSHFTHCPFCSAINQVIILADLVLYNCHECKQDYYVKREIIYKTITPNLLKGGNIEAVREND